MNTAKDVEFYNERSGTYSRDRYPAKARSYGQFFFKRRLDAVMAVLRQKLSGTKGTFSLLEVGCADGVVLRAIYDAFPARFASLHGVDTAPDMIEAAKRMHAQTPIIFSVRGEGGTGRPYDFVIEVGVINYADPVEEIGRASLLTKKSGYCVVSYAGRGSLLDTFKPGRKGFDNLLPYRAFEALLRTRFVVERVIPVGFFIPRIWRFPMLAAPLQAVIESVCSRILPSLAHEKIYILKKMT